MIRRSPRLLAAVAATAVLASACATGLFGDRSPTITAEFPSTFNLFEGSRVRVAGVDVGRVSTIDVPEGANTVTVTMTVREDVRLPADVRAVVVPQALLGERYVQLDPPYTEGPVLPRGATIPIERTGVPADFDEVLASLNDYLEALPEDEVARLVTNLAVVLDGQGENLGRTLENAERAIEVLRENDEELIALSRHLADLNEALIPHLEQVGEFIEDANTVTDSLAADREAIDAALDGLLRMTQELTDLLQEHRPNLEQDLGTLARVGRTAVRNLDRIDAFLFHQAELYRHAERVIQRDTNWLPLVNNFEELSVLIADRVEDRLVGLCLRLEIEACADPGFFEEPLPDEICFDPVLPCPNVAEGRQAVELGDALQSALDAAPELRTRLEEEGLGDVDELAEGLVPTAPPAPSPSLPDPVPSPGLPSAAPSPPLPTDGATVPPLSLGGVQP